MKLEILWNKSDQNEWYNFGALDFRPLEDACGVYVIWRADEPRNVVRLGQGILRDRLSQHQQDTQVMRHAGPSGLRVTWAVVHRDHLDGVENFLAARYTPLVGERFPACAPIEVNLVQ
jgi:hypothetical protein